MAERFLLILAQRVPSAVLHCILTFKEIWVSPKRGSETFPQTLDLEKFRHGTFTVAECYKQATAVSLLLTTPDDDGVGRGQVLSTVDRRRQ